DQDQGLRDQEDLDVDQEALGDRGQRRDEDLRVEERVLHPGPAGRVEDHHDDQDHEQDGRRRRDGGPPQALRPADPLPFLLTFALDPDRVGHFSSGAPAASLSPCSSILARSPLDLSLSMALSTHGLSPLPFSMTSPNSSAAAPPVELNWPTILEPSTCAAVT